MEGSLTLVEAGLFPSSSLNVFVQAPIVAPQPLAPSARLSDDIEMDEPSSGDDDSEQQQQQQQQPADEENDEAMDEDGEVNDEDGDDEDDDMMHALPIHGHQPHAGNPFAGRGRGRGRGRGGMAFSGAGHALGSSSSSAPTQQPATEMSTADEDANRRQRVLGAMANRAKEQGSSTTLEVAQHPKKIKERTVPSLQNLCSYEVAGNVHYLLISLGAL